MRLLNNEIFVSFLTFVLVVLTFAGGLYASHRIEKWRAHNLAEELRNVR